MNKYAFDLIVKFEGCKLQAYQDVVGVWTISYGHTGKDVYDGLTITQEEADSMLAADLAKFEKGVSSLVKVPISDQKAGALIDFSYNLGLHSLAGSTLLKKLNNNAPYQAAEEFLKWNLAGGKVIKGLTDRRKAEQTLFLSG